eukprot:4657294-Prymnesium_polylepis.1
MLGAVSRRAISLCAPVPAVRGQCQLSRRTYAALAPARTAWPKLGGVGERATCATCPRRLCDGRFSGFQRSANLNFLINQLK